MDTRIILGDCLDELRMMPDDSVDLIITSPPYEDQRTYDIGFKLKGQDWVDWAFDRFNECYRVCRGLTAWVVEGKTKSFQYSASPILLMADLHRAGVKLRKPPAFHRVGIPGSGGNDWLRNDYEFIVCASKGKLPWSDNTAMGKPPKYKPGGAMSYRTKDGSRVNDLEEEPETEKKHPTRKHQDGIRGEKRGTAPRYKGVKIANPGNVIKCSVGGGSLGSKLAHENEAPFPESLVEFFIRSFCPPGGTVLDPFCGSETTLKVAAKFGRNAIGMDVRESQTELSKERMREVQINPLPTV